MPLSGQKNVEHLGVTASQAMVLNFLGEEDRVLSSILGQKVQITSATMTGILDRLEKIDMVERQRHASDRQSYFNLSDRNRKKGCKRNQFYNGKS